MDYEIAEISAPKFATELRGTKEVCEGQTILLRCQLELVNDDNLSIMFYHNEIPLDTSPRHHIIFVFGYVALDIERCVPEDSGIYTLRVFSARGHCVTHMSVTVTPKKFKMIPEQKSSKLPVIPVPVTAQSPIFTQQLQKICQVQEGENIHFECTLLVGDPTLKAEWFRNETPIKSSFRVTKKHDLLHTGHMSMTIYNVCYLDEGVYKCRATNMFGACVTMGTVKISSSEYNNRRTIVFQPQYPDGLKKIKENEMQRLIAKMEILKPVISSPRFAIDLNGTRYVYEGQTANLRCQLECQCDPNFYIKFYHNGEALNPSCRCNMAFRFGYVSLDISQCVLEDAGWYSVELIDALGSKLTSTTHLTVYPKKGLMLESHPQQTRALKRRRYSKSAKLLKEPVTSGPKPFFTQMLLNILDIQEGQTVHLKCRVCPTKDPALKVEWFRNQILIEDDSRIIQTYDLLRTGCVSVIIARVCVDDEGIYICRATNLYGQAFSTCKMNVKTNQLMDMQPPEILNKNYQPDEDEDLCLVCGDKAFVSHYKVRTCDSCRKFFDDSMNRNLGYVCEVKGRCVVDVRRKNSCAACRFSKCLSVKMHKDHDYILDWFVSKL